MSTTEEIGELNGKLSTLQKKIGRVTLLQVENPNFLTGLLPSLAKSFDKRTVSSDLLALATKKDRFKIIESVGVAIENSDPETATKLFKRLDHMFQSEILVPDGQRLNVHVYNNLDILASELPKHFLYHYKNSIRDLYSNKHTEVSKDLLENIDNFVRSIPPSIARGMFDTTSIKVLYMIALFEMGECGDNYGFLKTVRAGLIVPYEYKFLGALQEFSPKRFDELIEELQNPDYKFFRNMFFDGKAYEERESSKRGSDETTEEVISGIFEA